MLREKGFNECNYLTVYMNYMVLIMNVFCIAKLLSLTLQSYSGCSKILLMPLTPLLTEPNPN